MLACHRRVSNEKFIDGVTGFDVDEQGLHGYARAGEHWSPAHDVGRNADDAVLILCPGQLADRTSSDALHNSLPSLGTPNLGCILEI